MIEIISILREIAKSLATIAKALAKDNKKESDK